MNRTFNGVRVSNLGGQSTTTFTSGKGGDKLAKSGIVALGKRSLILISSPTYEPGSLNLTYRSPNSVSPQANLAHLPVPRLGERRKSKWIALSGGSSVHSAPQSASLIVSGPITLFMEGFSRSRRHYRPLIIHVGASLIPAKKACELHLYCFAGGNE